MLVVVILTPPLQGNGASPEGNRPFLDLLDLETKQTTRLWQCDPNFYETPGSIMSDGDTVSNFRSQNNIFVGSPDYEIEWFL